MGRPAGARNAGYDERRRELAAAVVPRVLEEGPPPSLRELAAAAQVSVPTLRHYFESRDGVVAAALGEMLLLGEPHYRAIATPTRGDVRASLAWVLGSVVQGWREHGVGRFYRAGLTEGLGHVQLGPAFLDALLEPLLQASERRLDLHAQWGELHLDDVRAAALQLVSPLFLALLHQDGLGGSSCRPLDVDRFVELHLDAFLRAHAPRGDTSLDPRDD